MKLILTVGFSLICITGSWSQTHTQLAGDANDNYPYFQYNRSFNWDDEVWVSIDPARYPVDGTTADVYVVASKTAEEWDNDASLTDVRDGGFQTHSMTGTTPADVALLLTETMDIPSIDGRTPGVGYDVIFDMNQDGELNVEDYIDGYSDEAGMYLVSNMFEPGPFAVDTAEYSTSFWHTMRIFYPSNVEELAAQPLVVISHGWTHEYWFYDYLGYHLASYGYIVMSHRNDVGNGGALASTTASTTALENIDTLLTNVWDIQGGILGGKIDKNRIIHAGHSTGGECVVRAYTRLFTGDYVSPHITHENIVLVNSLAPVAFLSAEQTNPFGANYHQFLSAADTDVSGAAVDGYVQAFSIYERGYGNKQVTYIHGAGHEDLHGNYGDNPWAAGPDLIGKEAAHTIVKPYFLALCDLYSRNNLAMKDYFSRNRFDFRPSNIADSLVVSGEYSNGIDVPMMVIDDFETNEDVALASSGAQVSSTMEAHHEVLMQDIDGTFEWNGIQWSNGMTRARYDDDPNCAVVAWSEDAAEQAVNYTLTKDQVDWSGHEFLSFRACQITRHPLNDPLEHKNFTVTLTDAEGNSSSINFGEQGSINPPYPKTNGGILNLCLEEGSYTIEMGGSNWEEEQFFEIPGYYDEQTGVGSWPLEIGEGDPCTDIQILMYDSWGDGWDAGSLWVLDADDNVIAEGTLITGSTPDAGTGWQNEFNIIKLRLEDFLSGDSGLDLANMSSFSFQFGPAFGSETGAIGIDDIQLTGDGLNFVVGHDEIEEQHTALLYPNPAERLAFIRLDQAQRSWTYSIYNMNGQLVESRQVSDESFAVLERGDSPSGLYLVRIEMKDRNALLKLVWE